MAWLWMVTVYDKTWQNKLIQEENDNFLSYTIWDLISYVNTQESLSITDLATSKWWTELNHSNSLSSYWSDPIFYDVSPDPAPSAETITGFYLDGVEYQFAWGGGGWWAEYNAGEWIEIKNWSDYSAMRWPAPEWFHVPLITEWQWLKTIMDWLSLTTWKNWRINLHIPLAGRRRNVSTAEISSQGSDGYYWSSSPYGSAYPGSACNLYFGSSRVKENDYCDRAYGLPVRCFKDSFEVPTSSWTVINGTLWGAWIFWNQSKWLISITSDWTTWYTIQDKNLWATIVYSDWDTLSESNCGKYYQWGNNYGFAWTWSVTTSRTQVNAQNYWPWNYYSSSTFITQNNDWSSVHNDNLWWWVTWVVTTNNAITNTGVLSVNGQTWNVTIPESNVIAMTQAAYDALPEATKNDGKLRIITDATGIEMADKAYVDGLVGDVETLLAAL